MVILQTRYRELKTSVVLESFGAEIKNTEKPDGYVDSVVIMRKVGVSSRKLAMTVSSGKRQALSVTRSLVQNMPHG